MGLRIQKDRHGEFRSTWWGRISVRGAIRETNLNIPIGGVIPVDEWGNARLSAKGDEAFERSRKAALKAFEAWRRETQKDPAELQRKALKARTGVDLGGLPLSHLYGNWKDGVARAKELTPAWDAQAKCWFDRFAKFASAEARRHGKKCETANDVTPEIASAWFEDVKAAFAWETTLKQKHLLSGTFTRLVQLGLCRVNPFANIQLRGGGRGENKKISRAALTSSEIERLFECARDTDLYGLVVAAACTGMRCGDVCNLKWADVDMGAGLITCTTAKAGVPVTIPIFKRLRDVLEDCAPVPGDGSAPSPFVFPEMQSQYTRNRNKVFQDAKPLFARATRTEETPPAIEVKEDGSTTRPLPAVIDVARFTERKRARLLDVYARHKAGEKSIEIATALNVARSQVSMDLREIEKLTGEVLRPMATQSAKRKTRLDLIELTRQQRGIGKRAASVYGWHSLRHAFVVLALQAGVPVEAVRLIVGHGDAETTLDNYFNPEKRHAAELMRQTMAGSVLDGGDATTPKRIGHQAAPTLPAPVAAKSPAERLRELKGLADEGLITPEEYAERRAEIINAI